MNMNLSFNIVYCSEYCWLFSSSVLIWVGIKFTVNTSRKIFAEPLMTTTASQVPLLEAREAMPNLFLKLEQVPFFTTKINLPSSIWLKLSPILWLIWFLKRNKSSLPGVWKWWWDGVGFRIWVLSEWEFSWKRLWIHRLWWWRWGGTWWGKLSWWPWRKSVWHRETKES